MQIPTTPREIGNYVTLALEYIQQHLTLPVILLLMCMGFVGLGIAFFLFKKYGSRIKILEGLTSGSVDTSSGSSPQLLLFSTTWCPHCKVAQPEWDNLVSAYDGQLINGRSIIFTQYDCTAETAEVKALVSQYNIEGYPTVKLLKDGQIINFDAAPTQASLTQFLEASL